MHENQFSVTTSNMTHGGNKGNCSLHVIFAQDIQWPLLWSQFASFYITDLVHPKFNSIQLFVYHFHGNINYPFQQIRSDQIGKVDKTLIENGR